MPTAHINGINLYYEDHGRGDAIILAHGFSATGRMWEPQVRAFKERYRLVTYDARGQGRSAVPTMLEEYSQPLMVEDLRQLFRHLGIERACVGGLSMGGNVALNFTLAYPDMVAGLLVCDTGAGSEEPATWRAKVRRWVEILETQGIEAFADEYLADPIMAEYAGRGPAERAFLRGAMTSNTATGLARGLAGIVGNRPSIYALGPGLAGLTMPVTVLVGDRDPWCTKEAEFMATTIPRAELVVIRDSGHMTNLEQPDQFNEALARLLARISWRA